MIQTVTARAALVQSLWFDREKLTWAAASIATLTSRECHEHNIAVQRLHRCIGQINTLERWREGPNDAATAALRQEPQKDRGPPVTMPETVQGGVTT